VRPYSSFEHEDEPLWNAPAMRRNVCADVSHHIPVIVNKITCDSSWCKTRLALSQKTHLDCAMLAFCHHRTHLSRDKRKRERDSLHHS